MIFLTGGTGFLGRELLRRLVETRNEQIGLLIRAEDQRQGEERLAGILSATFGAEYLGSGDLSQKLRTRIQPIVGDVTISNFGLGEAAFRELAQGVTEIYHSAANTQLNLDLPTSRKINVGGTFHVSQLALTSKHKPRFHHVSTAYVAGDTERVVKADELRASRFRNSYEQSKSEAEAVIRALKDEIPSVIYRPSVIVGDSKTGHTSAFNVVYMPARLMASGILKVIPARPHVPFDIVPVDYVAEAIIELGRQQNLDSSSCFHLTSGVGRESSPREIVETLFAAFRQYAQNRGWNRSVPHMPSFMPPELLSRVITMISQAAHGFSATQAIRQVESKISEHISSVRQLIPFVPYMISNPQFDNRQTLKTLGTALPQPPLFEQYAESIFRYCFESNWGKRSLPAR